MFSFYPKTATDSDNSNSERASKRLRTETCTLSTLAEEKKLSPENLITIKQLERDSYSALLQLGFGPEENINTTRKLPDWLINIIYDDSEKKECRELFDLKLRPLNFILIMISIIPFDKLTDLSAATEKEIIIKNIIVEKKLSCFYKKSLVIQIAGRLADAGAELSYKKIILENGNSGITIGLPISYIKSQSKASQNNALWKLVKYSPGTALESLTSSFVLYEISNILDRFPLPLFNIDICQQLFDDSQREEEKYNNEEILSIFYRLPRPFHVKISTNDPFKQNYEGSYPTYNLHNDIHSAVGEMSTETLLKGFQRFLTMDSADISQNYLSHVARSIQSHLFNNLDIQCDMTNASLYTLSMSIGALHPPLAAVINNLFIMDFLQQNNICAIAYKKTEEEFVKTVHSSLTSYTQKIIGSQPIESKLNASISRRYMQQYLLLTEEFIKTPDYLLPEVSVRFLYKVITAKEADDIREEPTNTLENINDKWCTASRRNTAPFKTTLLAAHCSNLVDISNNIPGVKTRGFTYALLANKMIRKTEITDGEALIKAYKQNEIGMVKILASQLEYDQNDLLPKLLNLFNRNLDDTTSSRAIRNERKIAILLRAFLIASSKHDKRETAEKDLALCKTLMHCFQNEMELKRYYSAFALFQRLRDLEEVIAYDFYRISPSSLLSRIFIYNNHQYASFLQNTLLPKNTTLDPVIKRHFFVLGRSDLARIGLFETRYKLMKKEMNVPSKLTKKNEVILQLPTAILSTIFSFLEPLKKFKIEPTVKAKQTDNKSKTEKPKLNQFSFMGAGIGSSSKESTEQPRHSI